MFFKRVPSIKYSDLNKDDLVIDVREKHEYQSNHIRGSKNIPLGQIKEYRSERPVYVICASGARSKRAVKVLRNNGVEAYNIKGGMLNVKA